MPCGPTFAFYVLVHMLHSCSRVHTNICSHGLRAKTDFGSFDSQLIYSLLTNHWHVAKAVSKNKGWYSFFIIICFSLFFEYF